jgi:hypothetical protein
MYLLIDRPAKRMERSLPTGTSTSRMDLSGWWNPGQLTYSSHPPLLGQVLNDDAQLAYALDRENPAYRTSQLKIPPKKLSCIN